MNLQKELRHKSEDIDNQVLLDVVKALRRRVRSVNRDYDVPYIAGYSVDGKTIFIDRHLPRTFRWLLTTVRVEQFLLTHEIVEKALLDELRLHYLHAHQIAVRAERDAVKDNCAFRNCEPAQKPSIGKGRIMDFVFVSVGQFGRNERSRPLNLRFRR
jgi:hypothetical protein